MVRKLLLLTSIALALSVSAADARKRTDANGNPERFTCGYDLCEKLGISRENCRKLGLTLALNWPNRYPRVSQPAPGIVVVQSRPGRALGGGPGGHVSRIVSLTRHCRAIVQDNRGRYERNICKALVAYVAPQRAWTE